MEQYVILLEWIYDERMFVIHQYQFWKSKSTSILDYLYFSFLFWCSTMLETGYVMPLVTFM